MAGENNSLPKAFPNYTFPDKVFPSAGTVGFLLNGSTRYMYDRGVEYAPDRYWLVVDYYED
jgi:hypothetical protein